MKVKGIALVLLAISLSGCASFIANEITRSKEPNIKGNISDWVVEREVCDGDANCFKALGLSETEARKYNLTFRLNINDKYKIWRYKNSIADVENVRPLANQLVVIFAGYSQPTETLYIHQKWLQQITGADVLVIPSADNTANFNFGLGYTSPIVAEIQRLQPEKVHLVGFSMGALAATSVASEIDNAKLYLIAPMTDFENSAKAIFDSQYSDKIYANFVSQKTLEDAIQIVFEKSATTSSDIDLVSKLTKVKSPTFIYGSVTDSVVDHSVLDNFLNSRVNVNTYSGLNHWEMMALLNQNLMADFVSDLLGRTVLLSEVNILGVLCDVDDDKCLNQLSD